MCCLRIALLTLEELYHKHKKQVYNLALHYVQNIEEAQEITQDVFVSLNNGLEKFREDSSIDTWIYRITINKSLDYIKAKNRKKRSGFLVSLFNNISDQLSYSDFDHPGVLMEQKEAVQSIFFHINKLPANQKTVLILSKIESKSQREIAEILGISLKAVESLLQRAKTSLLNKLKPNEG
ncbi:MAG: RNA polymerase sigma factor [Bacteroidia bacterium]|nr:RNA polymerase sigma factor [Bacteroidia bacterium]